MFSGAFLCFMVIIWADKTRTTMKIIEMCEAERPREKMLEKGPGALGSAELLAILIRTGTHVDGHSESAVEVSNRLLAAAGGSLMKLFHMSVGDLSQVKGIKGVKALTVAAAIELGRRFMTEASGLSKVPVTGPDLVYNMMRPALKGLTHEECWVLFLNNARYVTAKRQMTSGGSSSTVIDVRGIVKEALDLHATGIILVHNHPSGNPVPGTADMEETLQLKQAAESMDISLLDHVVVCDDSYYSFSDERTVTVL